jgi:hypothetical protein
MSHKRNFKKSQGYLLIISVNKFNGMFHITTCYSISLEQLEACLQFKKFPVTMELKGSSLSPYKHVISHYPESDQYVINFWGT